MHTQSLKAHLNNNNILTNAENDHRIIQLYTLFYISYAYFYATFHPLQAGGKGSMFPKLLQWGSSGIVYWYDKYKGMTVKQKDPTRTIHFHRKFPKLVGPNNLQLLT